MNFGLKKRDNSIGTDIDSFRGRMNSLFDDFFSMEPTGFFETAWKPAVDVEEDEKNIYIKADIPGIEEKNLNVHLERNVLSISGEKHEEKRTEASGKRQIITERSYGSFMRSIALPEGVKADGITAEFKKGVLKVTVPKANGHDKRIKIDVK